MFPDRACLPWSAQASAKLQHALALHPIVR